ncbi:MAG: ABC transporter permease [Ilumatobacteraceae bacterium]
MRQLTVVSGRFGRRLLRLGAVLFLVTVVTALMVSLLPGDPVEVIIPVGTEDQRAQLRAELDLDEPVPVRYASWLRDFVGGDEDGWPGLGKYYTLTSDRPVIERVQSALPVSLQLMMYAQALALLIAIPVGVIAAYRAGGLLDRVVTGTAFAMLAIPGFALALVLSYYLGARWRLLPATGYVAFGESVGDHIRSMVLPAISLAAGQIAVYMRLLRTDMVHTLRENFITLARAKGLPTRRILFGYALKPSCLTLLTVAGLNIGTLIGGAVVIEVIFGLPGMGLLVAQAIGERQYVALQSLVAVIAVGYVLINTAVDLLYGVLDPRVRHARSTR